MTENKKEEKPDAWEEVESRNLIEPLRHLFIKVNGNAVNNKIWLDVWSGTLQLEKTDTTLYGVLNLISRGVENCIRRIEFTPTFPKQSAKLAVATLSNCAEFMKPHHLHESCNEGKGNFSADKMNILLMAGESLEARFSEPQLSRAQKEDLLALVEKLEKLIGSGALHPLLVAAIEPHIKMIRWAIQHYSIVGIDGLMRSCTDAWMDLRRAEDEGDGNETKEFKSTFAKLWQYVDRADKVIRITDKGFEVSQKALEFFDSLQSSAN